jgi:hypothetical protein
MALIKDEDKAPPPSSLDNYGTIKTNGSGAARGARAPEPIIKTAAKLRTMRFAPLKYIVPELIVEGCVLLAGRPKVGKSWFALDVALAVAAGRYCLGERKPEEGLVLYLALEDGDRRMQRRVTKLLPTFDGEWPEKFEYATQWPRADQGGVEKIDAWCNDHPDARLVVIDVFARFRAPSGGKSNNAYELDYAALAKLQELATRRAITILIIHHTRKGTSDDPVEEISGTLGLGGAADAFLILKKSSAGATLIGRGRDTEDIDLAVQFSKSTCRWTILGEAAAVQRSGERARILAALTGADEGLGVAEIMALAPLDSRGNADRMLARMTDDGEIERLKRGLYGLPGTREKIAENVKAKAKFRTSDTPCPIGPKVRSDDKALKLQDDGDRSDNRTHRTEGTGLSETGAKSRLSTADSAAVERAIARSHSRPNPPALGPPGDSTDDLDGGRR